MENTYALIKDGVVINSIVADEMNSDLENSLHEQWGTTESISVKSEDLWLVTAGTLWDGTNFIPTQGAPFSSWIWDINLKSWKAPVDPPNTTDSFIWNESMLEWVLED
jgi:hypothetical protein